MAPLWACFHVGALSLMLLFDVASQPSSLLLQASEAFKSVNRTFFYDADLRVYNLSN